MIRPFSLRTAGISGALILLGVAMWSFNSSTTTANAAAASVAQAQPPAKQAFGNASKTLQGAILVGNTLYLSGQLGTAAGRAEGIGGETKSAILAGQKLLKAAEMDLPDVVAVTVYLTDVADFQGMNTAYSELFSAIPRPTRTTVVVKELVVAGAKVEVTMTAVKAR